ncbi:hypothetical protein FRC09_014918 [Ceratobasidium sp. 395]|nr:hypothetical protein FRC09_014918 [Ceratobasidium sp. 395]
MLSTSPKRSSAAGKKREAPNGAAATTVPQKRRRKDKDKERSGSGNGQKAQGDGEQHWTWTALAGSSVSALAPLFTLDSRYFFTTAASSLQIFSTATGKLVSTIPAHTDTITALALHPLNPSQLFSASLDGTIKRWDTHHGALLETLRIDQPVTHIAVHAELGDEVFVATGAKSGKNSDSSYIFRITTKPSSQLPSPSICLSQPPKPHKSSRTIYVGKTRRATGLAVSSCGRFLIVVGETKAYVTRTTTTNNNSTGFTSFVSPDAITCLAVHPTEPYFATGDERGVVRLWYCLNDQAIPLSTPTTDPSSSKSKPTDPSYTAPTTTLHWHAHAVSALSFTPSGAQLLSGGEEAVLVVWQLHSGQREYVPRVGAPIGGVSVCAGPNGGLEYAIALMDGGVVFVGNDTLRIGRAVRRVRLDPNPTRPLPLTLHPRTDHVLLPAAHPSSLQILSRSTSSLIGEVQVAPANRVSRRDEAPIEPVRVTLVAMSGGREGKGKESMDGEWMATVDSRAEGEVYLKLWRWNATSTTATPSNLCTLNTRIDRPHGDDKLTSLAFSPSPSSHTLTTTGSDGLVKLWSVQIDKPGEEFWICTASFSYREHIPTRALFSPDGSLLAVVHGVCVTLWDVQTQKMCGVLSCVEVREPREVVFVGKSGRYVAVLGDGAVVLWDLVRFSVLWHVQLDRTPTPTHIISHPTNPTFALFQHPTTTSTRISIFTPHTPTPVRTRALPFKLADPIWSDGAGELGVVGFKEAEGSAGWSLVVAGDDVRQAVEQGQVGRGIGVDDTPFVPRTLFEDIFGRGAVVPANLETSKGKKKAKEEVNGQELSVRTARRKAKKLARKATKLAQDSTPGPATKPSVVEDEGELDSEGETPESSEPATEGDIELEAVAYQVVSDIKRKPSFLGVGSGDGTIQVTKKVNGVVGVHSASDEEDEEDEIV